jgi:hypothetical protein
LECKVTKMPFVKFFFFFKKKKPQPYVFSHHQRNRAIACRRRRRSPAQPSPCSPFLSPAAENQSRRRRRNPEDAEISQTTGPRRRKEPAREFAGENTGAQPIPLSLSPAAAENQSQDAGASLSPFLSHTDQQRKKILSHRLTEKSDQIIEI